MNCLKADGAWSFTSLSHEIKLMKASCKTTCKAQVKIQILQVVALVIAAIQH